MIHLITKRRLLFVSTFIAVSLCLSQAATPESIPLSEESLDFLEPISDQQRTLPSVPVIPDSDPQKETPLIKHPEIKEPPREMNRDIEEQVTNLFYLARNHEKSGNLPRAVESYKKALEIDPGNYRTMNNIAALLIRMNVWGESLGYLQDCIKLNDHYVPALINLGIVHARNGNSSEAERALLRAISLEEYNHSALFNIAVLYENEGSYDRAREYYQKLHSLGGSEGINGMKRLENK